MLSLGYRGNRRQRGMAIMVRIGTVWDRTVDVLKGRANILVPIAAMSLFLPSVVNTALAAFGPKGAGAVALLGAALALAVLLANIWGQLAMLAVATHPATTRADAGRQATARLLPALGVILAMAVLFALALVPPIVAVMNAGIDLTRGTVAVQSLPAGVSGFIGLYSLVLLVVAFVLGARLILLNPVILNERRGLGAVMRSVRLTRGLTLKIIGVMILFAIVLLVPMMAIQAIVGLVARLILGPDALPAIGFLAGVAGAAVTSLFSVVAAAFTAQLYVAVADDRTG
jgi:hypothetical protein